MSEGHNFEKTETPPQAKVDLRSVLESGEIINTYPLEGHSYIQVVEMKSGVKALFRSERDSDEQGGEPILDPQILLDQFKEKFRGDLEILAFEVDQVLKFNLVPTSVRRVVAGRKGVMQYFINEAKPAKKFDLNWVPLVEKDEVTKAAVFDYIVNARDRNTANFLIDTNTRKLWLIDNDFFMLMNDDGVPSDIRFRAELEGLLDVPEEILMALGRLVDQLNSLNNQVSQELSSKLEDIKQRVEYLLETKKIPTQTYLA